MTRYEKIREMKIKEMADYLNENIDCDMCRCKQVIEKWLEEADAENEAE